MIGYKQILNHWIEQYLFYPNFLMRIISILFFPLTILYCLIVSYKRATAKVVNYQIPIISIGNIIVGGSGKTPITIALASKFSKSAVILRGYKRKSKDLIVVSQWGRLKVDVDMAGDEAIVLAKSLPKSLIIVSQDRAKAIIKAKELGAKIVFLDDGFSKYNILKYDILIKPDKESEPTNLFCLPSGGYREPKMNYMYANHILEESKDFDRIINFKYKGKIITTLPEKLVLISAISKPKRLLKYLPNGVEYIFFEDHHHYSKNEIDEILEKYRDYTIVTTLKDSVKLDKYNLDYILMDLSIQFYSNIEDEIKNILKLNLI